MRRTATMYTPSRRFGSLRAVVLAGLTTLGACGGAPAPGTLDPRPVRTLETWVAETEGILIGRVMLLEIEDPAGPVRFRRAVNASGQWLGYIDEWQRVYRREPFAEREVYLGMYTMEEGLALLYERRTPVHLIPLAEFEAREAAHTPGTEDEK